MEQWGFFIVSTPVDTGFQKSIMNVFYDGGHSEDNKPMTIFDAGAETKIKPGTSVLPLGYCDRAAPTTYSIIYRSAFKKKLHIKIIVFQPPLKV